MLNIFYSKKKYKRPRHLDFTGAPAIRACEQLKTQAFTRWLFQKVVSCFCFPA